MPDPIKIAIQNRKARYDFEILNTFEAGIQLQGTEVKSLRLGKGNLSDAYARVEDGEVYLHRAHIDEYLQGNRMNHDPLRKRKLLLHKSEIRRLEGSVQEKGLTLIPLKVYFRNGRAKVDIALARGKRDYNRRRTIAQRDAKRDMQVALKRASQAGDRR
jgi:SsrA-binding protein